MELKRILCAVDFSDTSRAALEVACGLARRLDAELVLAHVYQAPGYLLPEGAVVAGPEVFRDLNEQVERRLAEWKALAETMSGGRPVAAESALGDIATEVVRLAEERTCDLIVQGTHGRTGLAHVFLGSTAEKVLRHSTVPVLTVPLKGTTSTKGVHAGEPG